MTKKLSHHPTSKCYVILHEDGDISFISYSTLVIQACKQVDGSYMLWCTGTYSQTTRRQIGWFLKEYFGDVSYFDMKRCAENRQGFRTEMKTAKYW